MSVTVIIRPCILNQLYRSTRDHRGACLCLKLKIVTWRACVTSSVYRPTCVGDCVGSRCMLATISVFEMTTETITQQVTLVSTCFLRSLVRLMTVHSIRRLNCTGFCWRCIVWMYCVADCATRAVCDVTWRSCVLMYVPRIVMSM